MTYPPIIIPIGCSIVFLVLLVMSLIFDEKTKYGYFVDEDGELLKYYPELRVTTTFEKPFGAKDCFKEYKKKDIRKLTRKGYYFIDLTYSEFYLRAKDPKRN
jgi:hypothetical protein